MSSAERAAVLRARADALDALAGLEETLLAAKAEYTDNPTGVHRAAKQAASAALREARALTRSESTAVGGDAYVSSAVEEV